MVINVNVNVKNVNIGLMGHVDSGKTSIAKCLSSTGGTACFDKSPQSQERGITLDLGFSTFNLKNDHEQVTIVDCPGHASLIRTILCGAQIIDLIVLVIDGTKGIQAQTAECLIIAQIMTNRLIFVINKIDLWPEEVREEKFESVKAKLIGAMKGGKFAECSIIPFSAILDNSDGLDRHIHRLEEEIYKSIEKMPIVRNYCNKFVFAVDHCFPIKGQGTILTGTVLQGQISVNEMIELSDSLISRKIKSIQSFKKSVKTISAGDRAGICVQSIDSENIERTLICTPTGRIEKGLVLLLNAKRIKHFKTEMKSKSKIHISILNETVLCKRLIFVRLTVWGYEYLEEMPMEINEEFYVIIELEKPVSILDEAIVIGSKLDVDPSLQKCRIAFNGKIKISANSLDDFCIYAVKQKISLVDRIVSENRIIGKGFGVVLSISKYINMDVSLYQFDTEGKEISKEIEIESYNYLSLISYSQTHFNSNLIAFGVIDSLFGSSGKFNVSLKSKIPLCTSVKKLILKLNFGKIMFKDAGKENCNNNIIFCIN